MMTSGLKILASEHQMLTLLAEGKSTKEIAFALGVSVESVLSCRARIRHKLGIKHHDTSRLVRYAVWNGLLLRVSDHVKT